MTWTCVVTFDPDKWRTAYALAVWNVEHSRFEYRGSFGGGTSKTPVDWQTITGQLALIGEIRKVSGVDCSDMLVVVETQGAHGTHSRDVEELRRMRYHLQAACELLGITCKFVSIGGWGEAFVPGSKRLGVGAQKKAYMSKAKAMAGGETANEDQCAAFGMLVVELASKNFDLYIDSALHGSRIKVRC